MSSLKIPPILWFTFAVLLALGTWSYFWWERYGLLPEKVKDLSRNVELLSEPKDTAKIRGIDLQKLDLKIEKTEQSIREDFDWLKKLGLPLTLLAFAGLFFSIYKSALGFALTNAKEAIDKAYLPDEEVFKMERKILVLTKKGGDTDFVREFFKQTGFWAELEIPTKNLETEIKDEETALAVLNGKTYDLIFFNDESVQFTNEEIQFILGRTPASTMLFSFGRPNDKRLSDALVKDKRVGSASFKSQIYGNLINALKYQKYLRQTPKGRNA